MKKLIILLITTGLISCSGLTMESKRNFADHTFHASNPSMAVKLADTFSRVEQKKGNTFSFYSNVGLSGTSMDIENYRFFDPMRMRQFVINIKKLNNGYWNADLNRGIPRPLETGDITECGRKYQYSIFAVKTAKGDNLLIKRFARCSGAQNRTLIEYSYMQQIGPFLGDYSKWQDAGNLTEEQTSFLSQFKMDCEKDIRFIEFMNPQRKKL